MIRYETVSKRLKESLNILMASDECACFRLVGGTALSLQLGHRKSVDIDLFTDAVYGSISFEKIEHFLKKSFPYVDHLSHLFPGIGKSYVIGESRNDAVKLDLFYTDTFIRPALEMDGIRMATTEEIAAMKIDVVQRSGRKKDFWDLHELLDRYSFADMLRLHHERYEYAHDEPRIVVNFTNFRAADDDFDPICLRGKYWEFIKEDLEEAAKSLDQGINQK